MSNRWSLRRRLVSGLIVYLILLTLGVLANDIIVNERAEDLVWDALLSAEMNYFLAHRKADKNYQLPPMESLELFEFDLNGPVDPQFIGLEPGIHDELVVNGRERVLLVSDSAETRFILALDIVDLERNEFNIRETVFVSAFFSVVFLGLLAAWGVTRLSSPLRVLADQIRMINPENTKDKIALPKNSSAELAIIVDALNGLGKRIDNFVEREREFVSMASHELRTPLTIIDGAVSLTLQEPALPEPVKNRMLRVNETIKDVNEMVALLLVLAKNPERLSEMSESVELDAMVFDIVTALQPLANGKGLKMVVEPVVASTMHGPPTMIKSAIANLIRNAIEHTHAGQISVELRMPATVIITNPGREASSEEVAHLYQRLARGGSRDGGGIGLALISRLCTHCGWKLSIQGETNALIRMELRFT